MTISQRKKRSLESNTFSGRGPWWRPPPNNWTSTPGPGKTFNILSSSPFCSVDEEYINAFPGWHPQQGPIVEWPGLPPTRVRPTQIVQAEKSQRTFSIPGIASIGQASTAAVPIITDIQMEFHSTTIKFHSTTTTEQEFRATEEARGCRTTCEVGGTTSTTTTEPRMGAGRSFWGMVLRIMGAGGFWQEATTHTMGLADRCSSYQSGETQFVSSF